MLKFNGSSYEYGGREYDNFYDALVEMLYDATWKNKQPKFDGINPGLLDRDMRHMYFLLLAMFDLDIVAAIESPDYKSYAKVTGTEVPYGEELFRDNPLWSMKCTMPATYRGNYSIQSSMLPMINEVYGKYNRSVQCANGKFQFKQVISLIADKILFNPETTPFEEVMDIYVAISSNDTVKSLCEYIRNEDLPKARILAMQISEDDLLENEFVSIGDLRKARYNCKTKQLWGDSSYMETMLSLPPSMQADDYFTWLNNAGHAAGKDLGLDEKISHREVKMGDYGLDLQSYERDIVDKVPAVEQEKEPERITPAMVQEEEVRPTRTESIPEEIDVEYEVEKLLGFSIDKALFGWLTPDLEMSIKEGASTDTLVNKVRLWYADVSSPKYRGLKRLAEYVDMPNLEPVWDSMPDDYVKQQFAGVLEPADLSEEFYRWYNRTYRKEDRRAMATRVLGKKVADLLFDVIPEDSFKDDYTLEMWYENYSPPSEDYGPLREQAELYCRLNGLEFLSTYSGLREKGYSGERLYRALPLYIKEK